MIRFLLSIIILTLIVSYAIIPLIKYLKSFVKAETKRIDSALTNTNEKDEVEDDK